MRHSHPEITADRRLEAEAALEQMPGNIAAILRRAPTCTSLAYTFTRLAGAVDRETVRSIAGYFQGLAHATWVSVPPDHSRKWTAEEWETLKDYGAEMEARTLLSLNDD